MFECFFVIGVCGAATTTVAQEPSQKKAKNKLSSASEDPIVPAVTPAAKKVLKKVVCIHVENVKLLLRLCAWGDLQKISDILLIV